MKIIQYSVQIYIYIGSLIPKFLKFRIPNNGCFDNTSVHNFQRQLLNKELIKAEKSLKEMNIRLEEKRATLREAVPSSCLPSVILHSRIKRKEVRRNQRHTHNKKLCALSEDQERPLFNVQNTVVMCDLNITPPNYVLETLSLGPKNAVLDKFEPKDVLAELDGLINHCTENNISDQTITNINVKTLNYIKKCKN